MIEFVGELSGLYVWACVINIGTWYSYNKTVNVRKVQIRLHYLNLNYVNFTDSQYNSACNEALNTI